jgi:hypothetical protein
VNALVCFSSNLYACSSASVVATVAAPSASAPAVSSSSELPELPSEGDSAAGAAGHALAHCSVADGARRESGNAAGRCSGKSACVRWPQPETSVRVYPPSLP